MKVDFIWSVVIMISGGLAVVILYVVIVLALALFLFV